MVLGTATAVLLLLSSLTHTEAALSKDEIALQHVAADCKQASWPVKAGVYPCNNTKFQQQNYFTTVTCDKARNVVGLELSMGAISSGQFSCLTRTLLALKNLKKLRLYRTGLAGAIPSDWGSLTSLEELSVVDHRLTGTLPATLGKLKALKKLEIAGTDCCISALKGPLYPQWGALTNLETLNLAFNQITGATLPPQWSTMKSLKTMNLALNQISGPIPSSWTALKKLEKLSITGTKICGPIPAALVKKVEDFTAPRPKCPAAGAKVN